MYSEDYIIRLVQQLVAFVSHIAKLNRSGEHDKALAAAERAWGELLDVPRAMIDALDTPSLAAMLRDPARIRAAAQLLVEEGQALTGTGDSVAAAVRFRRALELFFEARAANVAEQAPGAAGRATRHTAAPNAPNAHAASSSPTSPTSQDDAAIQELLRIVPVEALAPRYRARA